MEEFAGVGIEFDVWRNHGDSTAVLSFPCFPQNAATNTSDLSGYPTNVAGLLLPGIRGGGDPQFPRKHVMNRNSLRDPDRTWSAPGAKGEKDVYVPADQWRFCHMWSACIDSIAGRGTLTYCAT